MSNTPRKDDTQIRLRVIEPMSDAEALKEIARMVRSALTARASLVSELGEGVEYEAQLARERLGKHGVDADLSAIRIGEYFKRMTEFNILQRLNRAISAVVDGCTPSDNLGPDGEES
jgi:hypothetical protein